MCFVFFNKIFHVFVYIAHLDCSLLCQNDQFFLGEIISQRKVPVSKNIKLPELTKQLSDIGAEMLVECISTLPQSIENAKPQSEEGVTYGKLSEMKRFTS